ncbi:hypothetical protein ABPG75_006285 [Micractinium tetrahymenae]
MLPASPGNSDAAGATAASAPSVPLNEEQRQAAHAPLDEALVSVAAEAILVLTFSRKAQAEFQSRLAPVPGASSITVSTFHAWAWQLLQRYWRVLGFARQPTLMEAEEQLQAVVRDSLVWDRLAEVQASMRAWLFLPPSAGWPAITAAAVERHAGLYAAAVCAALEAHHEAEQPGSWAALTPAAAAAAPLEALPPRLQMLLLLELHGELRRRFSSGGDEADDGGAHGLLAAASRAPAVLSWVEAEKRQGRMPDVAAYSALCAAQSAAGGVLSEAAERHRRLLRVAAAYQAELQRQCLVSLSDLLPLARALLERGGEALRWARCRWTHVLVDEFQDTSRTMLDLVKLLMGERRSITVVGDDDQSIYAFLAALPAIFAAFREHFSARLLCLQTNFRSSAAICAFGSSLLLGNRGRAADKAMLPARGGPCAPVTVRQYGSAAEEAAALAREVDRLWRREGVPLRGMAALFRCLRRQGAAPHAPLMAELRRRGIPFEVVGQSRLAEDEGVGALISYLALVANPACDPAFETVLQQPYHGLGHDVRSAVAQQRHAARLAGHSPPSLFECAELLCTQAAVPASAGGGPAPGALGSQQLAQLVGQLPRSDLEELQRLVGLLRGMQRAVGQEPLPQAVRRVLRESGLEAWVQRQQDAAALAGDSSGCGSGSGASQAAAAGEGGEQLPPRLHSVVLKAQQLAAEWQQQGSQQAAAPGDDSWAGWLQGGSQSQGEGGEAAFVSASQQQQQGVELVRELLVRLATGTTVDSAADLAGADGSAQQAQQCYGADGAASDADPGVFTISTIHGAKGLEWDAVLLPSVCDGHLPVPYRPSAWQQASTAGGGGDEPYDHCAAARAHYEEERRLFHVAATRARDLLLVSYVQPLPAEEAAAEAGEEALGAAGAPSQAGFAASQRQWGDEGHEDPSQLPRCSSVLAATLRHLRRERADAEGGLLRFEGRLPEQDFPGLWRPLAEESGGAGQPVGGQRGALTPAGGNSQPAPASQRLSLAEQCRQRLAAKGAGAGGRGGGSLRGTGVVKRAGGGRGRGLRAAAVAEPG